VAIPSNRTTKEVLEAMEKAGALTDPQSLVKNPIAGGLFRRKMLSNPDPLWGIWDHEKEAP
jgi:hypothetical protein